MPKDSTIVKRLKIVEGYLEREILRNTASDGRDYKGNGIRREILQIVTGALTIDETTLSKTI